MLRKKRSLPAPETFPHPDVTTLLLRAELADLRQLVEMLRAESLTHLRRIGELQYEIDRLKKLSAIRERAALARADGSKRE